VTPSERQTLSDAQAALLDAMVAAARAVATISTLIVADKASAARTEDRVARGLMFDIGGDVRPAPSPHPKPGPPKGRS